MKSTIFFVSLWIGVTITFVFGYLDYETPSWFYLFKYFFTTVDGGGAFVSFTVIFTTLSYLVLRTLKHVTKVIMKLNE